VYREIEPLPGAVTKPEPDAPVIPAPINPAPLTTQTFSEPVPLLDGRKRCYTVRAIRGTGAATVEGEASMPACVTPTDDFPPAAPVGLSSTVESGAISLSWAPNTEADLAGYVVLRGEAGDATLTPLTGSVITDAIYVDRTVKPGVRYVYAVKAIDTHLPTPNVSGESERVEETAR
jgi:fibronectin type 3 domain-containing protein